MRISDWSSDVCSSDLDADGIVGDLGGGSLELVRVAGGELCDRASFPLGVLRLAAIRERGDHTLERYVGKMLKRAGWADAGEGRPLYLVGGSWRALARLDMHIANYSLPLLHQYTMTADAGTRFGPTSTEAHT